jgi:hypothetical protein
LLARQPYPQSITQRNAMSNPPYPPANPGDNPGPEQNKPEHKQPEQAPGQPQYGQNPPAPQYGQNAPQYGQNPPAPQYGQNPPAPQYGQNPPQYGQQPSAPQYGENAPQFGAPQYGQSQQYGQPQQFGQAPQGGQAPWPSQQPAATSGVPQLVNNAFLMIVAAGVLSAISSLVFAFTGGDYFAALMQESANQQGTELPPGFAESMGGILVVSGIIGAVINLGLYALVAFPVRKGRNWARILGTVFAGLSLFGLFGGLFEFGPLFGTLQLVTILLGIAAIVLLYLPASAPYFRKAQPFGNPYQNPYGR